MLVGETRLHEMLVGLASVIASAMFLSVVRRSIDLELKFTWRDVLTCWRIPWYVVSKCFQITKILFRDIWLGKRAGSHYRVAHFVAAKGDPVLAARQVLATAYTTAAPNFLVIGIDDKQGLMLFHQLERTSVSEMTAELGAR